jgi:signal transduction histidine kinase
MHVVTATCGMKERGISRRSHRLRNEIHPWAVALRDASRDAVWQLAADAAALGTFEIRADDVWCDARGRTLFGLPQDGEGATHGLADLIGALASDDRGMFIEAVRTARGSEHSHRIELRDARGTWLAVSMRSVDGALAGIVEDISERKATEDALTRAERTRELIAGVLGHELHSPASAILIAVGLLQKQASAADRAVLDRVLRSGNRMATMVDELVTFARVGLGGAVSIEPIAVDLAIVIERCFSRLRGLVPRHAIGLRLSGDTNGTWDVGLLSAVLLSLLEDALNRDVMESAAVNVDGADATEVVVTVSHKGVIPRSEQAALFEIVRTGDPRPMNGLGLGLFNARAIVTAHEGSIDVRSSQAEGTTFVVRLPRHRPTQNLASTRVPAWAASPPVVSSTAPSTPTSSSSSSSSSSAAPPLSPSPSPSPSSSATSAAQASNPNAPKKDLEVTAAMFGASPLHERSPVEYWPLLDRYTRLLQRSLDRRTYRDPKDAAAQSDELRVLADELGALRASAREVADMHARALGRLSLNSSMTKSQALVTEGRLLSLELMGNLVTFYRRRAGFAGGPVHG